MPNCTAVLKSTQIATKPDPHDSSMPSLKTWHPL